MTPAQIDHLRRIDAHLAKLLQEAETRSLFQWSKFCQDNTNLNGYAVDGLQGEVIACRCTRENAAFIASCAGNAEAGWKATRAAILALLEMNAFLDSVSVGSHVTNAIELVQLALLPHILAAFPLEMLTE